MSRIVDTQIINDQQINKEQFEIFLELIKTKGIEKAIQDAIIQATIAGNWHKVSQLADFAVGIEAVSLKRSKSVDEDDNLQYLELPKCITNALEQQGIVTVSDLIEWTFEELLTIKDIRASSAQKIARALEKKLGITLPGWKNWQRKWLNKNQHQGWKQPQRVLKLISN
ncbi:MAG: DNA-directed RNA polymerase subunit alpha C-terminal domain-containing protein [Coleofasciculaceae cyanobacterium]